MVLPDELMTVVKCAAVHQRRKLNDLVPELIRIGLAHQQADDAGGTDAPSQRRAQAWLEDWQKLGAGLQARGAKSQSCVSLLEADRGTRG